MRIFGLTIVLAVFTGTAWAQSSVSGTQSNVAPTESNAAATHTNVAAPLAGNAVRAIYGELADSRNTLTTTISVNTQIDDNALNSRANKLTDAISNFSPNFAWSLARQRWTVESDYTPSFTYSLQIPGYDNISHSLSNQLSVQLAQHSSVRFRNVFVRTADPFGFQYQSQLVPGFGVLDRPNPTLVGPPSLYTSEQAGMDLTYMPAAHTTLGISGTYAAMYYDNLAASSIGNRDTHSANGRIFLDQKLSARQSVSIAYNYMVITSRSYGRTVSHSVLFFDNWRLNPRFQISLFAGPEYIVAANASALPNILPLKTGLSWSAGGTLSWSGQKTGASVSAIRQINNGGGLGGAVEMTSFTGNISRSIGRKWSTSMFASYTLNGSNINPNVGNYSVSYVSVGGGFNRPIIRNVSADVRYEYIHEGVGVIVPTSTFFGDHNRVTIGLRYTFSHSLGR